MNLFARVKSWLRISSFSLIDTVLVKALPLDDPQQLLFIDNSGGKSGGSNGPPYPCFERLRDHNCVLSGIAAFDERAVANAVTIVDLAVPI